MARRVASEPPLPEPLSLRAQLARVELVRVAMDVFTRLGVDATRVEDLLEAGGIARRTFYKYFRSKEDVLAALYELVTRELLGSIESAAARESEPMRAVHEVLDAYLAFHVTNHAIVRLLVEEAMRSGSRLAPLRRQFRDRLVRALDDAFVRASGKRVDPFVFVALVSGLEGLSLEILQRKPDAADVARVRASMLGLLDATLRAADRLPRAPR